jgi:hypothetical protein
MKQELTVRLRREVRRQIDLGLMTLETLAVLSDLSVTTLKRFSADGDLSTGATMRLAQALGLVHRVRFSPSIQEPLDVSDLHGMEAHRHAGR